jgi:HAT1-interacting factor 1
MIDPKQVVASATASAAEPETKSKAKISFSGDAEDDEDDEDGENENDEDKEDDFQIAWEVLETAKTLYESQLEKKKGKAVAGHGTSEEKVIERKIADVCDLLGEVSIENGMPVSYHGFDV